MVTAACINGLVKMLIYHTMSWCGDLTIISIPRTPIKTSKSSPELPSQALSKQFAMILDFVLAFDDLKVRERKLVATLGVVVYSAIGKLKPNSAESRD